MVTNYFNPAKIEEKVLKNAFIDFIGKNKPSLAMRELGSQIIYFKPKDIKWDFIVNDMEHPTSLSERLKFIVFLYEKGIYKEYNKEIKHNKENLLSFGPHSFKLLNTKNYINTNPLSYIGIKTKTYKGAKSVISIIINDCNYFCNDLIRDYLNNAKSNMTIDTSVVIEKIFNTRKIDNLYCFDDKSFVDDYLTLKKCVFDIRGQNRFKELCNLYMFIQYKQQNNKKNDRCSNFIRFTCGVLNYRDLYRKLNEGYEAISMNDYKIYPNMELPNKIIYEFSSLLEIDAAGKAYCFDFTSIHNIKYLAWIKKYYLKESNYSITNKNKQFFVIVNFANYINDSKCNLNDLYKTIRSYKHYLYSEYDLSESTIYDRIKTVQKFCRYLYSYGEIDDYSDNYFNDVIHYHADSNPDKRRYSREELKLLEEAYKNEYLRNNDPFYYCCYVIFNIALKTEIRESTILRIQKDSLSLNSNKVIDKVFVRSKTSKDNKDKYLITPYISNLICNVIDKTKKLRIRADKNISNYLFIYNSTKKKIVVRTFTYSVIHNYHKKICKKNNIEYLPFKTLRNIYNQNVTDYIIEKNYPLDMIEKLTKHGIDVHEKHYVEHDVFEVSEKIKHSDLINSNIQCNEKYIDISLSNKEFNACISYLLDEEHSVVLEDSVSKFRERK